MGEMCYILPKMFTGGIPSQMMKSETEKRMNVVDAMMKRTHIHEPHWYVYAFGVDSAVQGQGNGRELMSFLTSMADKSKHKMYLETFGPRNIAFYEKNGFAVTQKVQLDANKFGKLELHGGAAAMVRTPQ